MWGQKAYSGHHLEFDLAVLINMMILTEYFSGFSGFLLLFILNFTKNFDTILSIDCENNLIPEIQASTGDLP